MALAVRTATFKPNFGFLSQGFGDIEARQPSAQATNPETTQNSVGRVVKSGDKASLMARYFLGEPDTGATFVGDGTERITKAKITFELFASATIDAGLGEFLVGIMNSFPITNTWVAQSVCFDPFRYPLREDLPSTSDTDDVVIPGNLFQGVFLNSAAPLLYGPAIFPAGAFISLADGYAANFTLTDFVSSLNALLADPTLQDRIVGITLDNTNTPTNLEFFQVYDSFTEPAHSGMILELEWVTGHMITPARSLAQQRVTAGGSTVQARVVPARDHAQQRLQAQSEALNRVQSAAVEAAPRVRAPGSYAKSGGDL